MKTICRLLAILCCVIIACGFTFRVNDDYGTLDWGNGEVQPLIVLQLMEGLTSSGKDGEPVPALASAWSMKDHARLFLFTLRAGASWSDGVPVCAQHFVDAWKRVLAPEFASPYAHYLSPVKSMRVHGCGRLEVRLKYSAAYFPALASHWVLAPIRLDLLKKFGSAWTKPANLAVTGPYMLEDWVHDKQFILKRNPRYYGAAAFEEHLKAVVVGDDATALNLFQAGRLDWLRDVPFLEKKRLAATPEFSVFPSFVGYHLGFDFIGPGALDRGARCALALSLEKTNIPRILKGGETPSADVVPPGLGGNVEAPLFDATKARVLWNASPWSKRGPLELSYYTKDIHGVLAQWIQEEWRKNLGVEVRLVPSEPKTYWARLQRQAPAIFLSGITATSAHPYSFISEFATGSGGNWGHFSSKEYDALATKISAEDSAGRVNLRRARQLLLEQECAVIPLYFRQSASLLARGWQGLSINPMTYVYLKSVRRTPSK